VFFETALRQPGLTDLVYNGHEHGFALIEGRWHQLPPLESEEQLVSHARELCARGGRHIDLANPFADVSVEGYRIHAVLAAGVTNKTILSIRTHSAKVVPIGKELQEIVDSRANFLITGATGSGKTTLLRSMLDTLRERVITIEDVAELALSSPMAVSMVSRQANVEGKGEICLEELFRQALRMRPERLVLGEVRGREFGLMLQALNTGHAGSAATLHANSIETVAARVIGLGMLSGMSREATELLAASAITFVIHLSQSGMKIARMAELLG
jgi:pilus assembly protein CpaF